MFLYLAGLMVSIIGLGVADWRFKLAVFVDANRTVRAVLAGWVVLLVWDAIGIAADIFHVGASSYATGWLIAPDMPIEEPVFLFLLCYLSLLTFIIVRRRLHV